MKVSVSSLVLSGLLLWGSGLGAAEIPVKRLVLYTSGVGFFEHEGTVEGNDRCTLNFTAEQLNDLLKTLVIQDLDGGSIGLIRYPAQNPLNKALEAFPINVSGNLTAADLLRQLRGAEVAFHTVTNRQFTGTVLGVETKSSQNQLPVESVSLLTSGGIEMLPLESIRTFAPTDAKVLQELHKALGVLASDRNGNRKPFTIEFLGQNRRRVRFGYTMETPIWKTSYRLVFDPELKDRALLQGWAIVENQTDSDWNGLELSLVSGDPVFLLQNLYQSQYRYRPTLPVLRERALAEGNSFFLNAVSAAPAPAQVLSRANKQLAAADADRKREAEVAYEQQSWGRKAGAGVPAVAGSELGELFEYKIEHPVSLERRQSTMLELISEAIPAEKLLLFNREDGQTYPYNGALLTNSSNKLLLRGPLAVYDQNAYGGDSELPNLVASGDAVIRYSLALDVKTEVKDLVQKQEYQSVKFLRGTLEAAKTLRNVVEYQFINQGEKPQTLLLYVREEPQWQLAPELKPWKTENGFYRFRLTLEPKKTLVFPVEQRRVIEEKFTLRPQDWNQFSGILSTAQLTPEQREAWQEASRRYQEFTLSERKVAALEQELKEMDQNVSRTRNNINALRSNDDFRQQLVSRLNQEIQQLDALQQQRKTARQQSLEAQTQLENYLRNLAL